MHLSQLHFTIVMNLPAPSRGHSWREHFQQKRWPQFTQGGVFPAFCWECPHSSQRHMMNFGCSLRPSVSWLVAKCPPHSYEAGEASRVLTHRHPLLTAGLLPPASQPSTECWSSACRKQRAASTASTRVLPAFGANTSSNGPHPIEQDLGLIHRPARFSHSIVYRRLSRVCPVPSNE